jgi:zinc transporter ZupT
VALKKTFPLLARWIHIFFLLLPPHICDNLPLSVSDRCVWCVEPVIYIYFFFKLCATLFFTIIFFHGVFNFLKKVNHSRLNFLNRLSAPSTFTYWIPSSHAHPPPLAFHILIIVTYYLAWSYREIPHGLLKYLLFSLLVFSLDTFIFPISSKKFSP